ncbi:MAG: MFS transporter [Desulfobacterales bacterium]|nr:MFS transporter [Desulfobacterales bacterium]
MKPKLWSFFSVLLHFRPFESLRYRDYRFIWYGQIVASMGQWMDEVTRGWLVYELTNSVVQLGLVRGVQAIPLLLLSPLAGSIADRYCRKSLVLWSQILIGLQYAAMAFLIYTGWIRPWHLYITAFLMASAQTFLQPARSAIVADAVPPGCLTNAIGINSVVWNLARTTGPALSGILIAMFGTGNAYSVQSGFFFLATFWTIRLSSVLSFSVRADGLPVKRELLCQSIIEGLKFSWRNEAVRIGLITVMTVSFFIVPFRMLLPVFARDLLGIGATGQGWLLTSMGIGAMFSSVLIMFGGDKLPRGKLMLGSATVYGCILVIFAASPWFHLSLAMMLIAGICNVLSHALVQTVIQYHSPSEFRGRTMAIFNMSQVIMTAGSIILGSLSSLLGVRWALASMGTIGALALITIYLALPRARLIR